MQSHRTTTTLCKRRRAIIPTTCRFCGKQIYVLEPFYKIPWYSAFCYGLINYKDFYLDHHCKECHDKKTEQFGHCPKCQAFIPEKKIRGVKIEICLR